MNRGGFLRAVGALALMPWMPKVGGGSAPQEPGYRLYPGRVVDRGATATGFEVLVDAECPPGKVYAITQEYRDSFDRHMKAHLKIMRQEENRRIYGD